MGIGRLNFLFLVPSFLILLSWQAWAGIEVDQSIIEFEPDGEYYTDITVSNRDEKKAYVSVSVFEISNPGQPNEKREPLTDPDKAMLIATPTRLALEPNQSIPVRLLNLDEEQKEERIYRVLVEPASKRMQNEASGVRLLVGYEMLVIIRPQNPQVKVLASRSGKTMTFYNAGNTNVFMEGGKNCNPAKPSECQEVSSQRLYPKARWSTELPFAAPVEFSMNAGEENTSKQRFDGNDKLP
ncbi:fimbrial biogenesis chaperone [Parendozoicomonas haliclonae]|uniref:Pili assembly chaperone N-terminal domain-containing protein n=1 Tax=Parendozoicomonas haliclonae TaxID=1960125 RepID=A0A1X7AGP9_9GAMM|nr:fimbria/pilus periplasmic chaperone [Parendozoicomonas haliclonae]SMA39308.1 hypothetical protein EHSB41UT_01008 [Parendozoicomonas haliclonae]